MKEKRTNIIRLAMIIGMIFLCSFAEAPSNTVACIAKAERVFSADIKSLNKEWNKAYAMIVDSIKLHEKFMPNPYICPGGQKTIGYGHAIKTTDCIAFPLSEQAADSLLKSDLNVAIEYVKRTTKLQHMQLLAMGHFVFCLGSGSFEKSTLKQLVIHEKPIDEELMKWVHIQTKHGKVASNFLRQIRTMELQIYNS